MRTLLTLSIFASLAALGSAQVTIDNDHTDLAITYDETLGTNGLGMNVHYDPTDDDYDASQVTLAVYQNDTIQRPSSSSFDFIGNAAGDTTWFIDQSQVPDHLYLGIGMDSLDAGDPRFLSYVQNDARFNTTDAAEWTSIRLVSFSGPGQVSTWYNTPSGPSVLFATSDGINPTSDFGLTPIGGDNHFNWAFTATGSYDLKFQASTYLADGTEIVSPVTNYHFAIGGQPVPEPASMAALGLGALGLLRRRRKA